MDTKLKLASVEVKLPPDAGLVSPLRLFVSGMASRLGFGLDEIEDLKLTIGEVFLAIVEKCAGTKGLISLKWEETPESLNIRVTDPSHTFTRVYSEPIFHLLEKIADGITYGDEKQPEVNLSFDLKDKRKDLFTD